jgi:hypothetical protein
MSAHFQPCQTHLNNPLPLPRPTTLTEHSTAKKKGTSPPSPSPSETWAKTATQRLLSKVDWTGGRKSGRRVWGIRVMSGGERRPRIICIGTGRSPPSGLGGSRTETPSGCAYCQAFYSFHRLSTNLFSCRTFVAPKEVSTSPTTASTVTLMPIRTRRPSSTKPMSPVRPERLAMPSS